jgi:hypothetical protein
MSSSTSNKASFIAFGSYTLPYKSEMTGPDFSPLQPLKSIKRFKEAWIFTPNEVTGKEGNNQSGIPCKVEFYIKEEPAWYL